jgi:type II secretory pathway pseudopilin PulG
MFYPGRHYQLRAKSREQAMRDKEGFILIELIVVIGVLGILAAFSVTRLAGMHHKARSATVQGLQVSLRGAALLAHGKQLARGLDGNASISASGSDNIRMKGTWPTATADGITRLIQDISGFNSTTGTGSSCVRSVGNNAESCITFHPTTKSADDDCKVSYGINSTAETYIVNATTSGC